MKRPDDRSLFGPLGPNRRHAGPKGCAVRHDPENSPGFPAAYPDRYLPRRGDHRGVPSDRRTVPPVITAEPFGPRGRRRRWGGGASTRPGSPVERMSAMATPVDAPLGQDVVRERARARRILVLSAVLALLVMGAVVALGLNAAHARPRRPRGIPLPPRGLRANRESPSEPEVDDGCPVDPDHPPRVAFDLPPSGLDFGEVKQGAVLEQEVVVRNEGRGTLCIRRVESGCGCIKAKLSGDARRVEPGRGRPDPGTLDTQGKDGEQKKTIRVYTNAVDEPV